MSRLKEVRRAAMMPFYAQINQVIVAEPKTTHKQIAERFGVSQSLVSAIARMFGSQRQRGGHNKKQAD